MSTVYRQRKAAINERATKIRKSIKDIDNTFLVVHWDSKIIQLLSGQVQDRLAICISSPNKISGQFIASPELPSGTGMSMANAVLNCLQEMNMDEQVHAVVFDTTASNWNMARKCNII